MVSFVIHFLAESRKAAAYSVIEVKVNRPIISRVSSDGQASCGAVDADQVGLSRGCKRETPNVS